MIPLYLALLLAVPIVPFTEGDKTAIKEAVGRYLKDPFSAQYEWPEVKNGTVYCGFVNAKNSFGAYDGFQPFLVTYYVNQRTKKVVVSETEMSPFVVNQMCPESGYRIK